MLVDLDSEYLNSEVIKEVIEMKTLDSNNVSYSEFYSNYIIQNKPCVIKNLTTDWLCQKMWVIDGGPNFDYLDNNYGSASVPVANCDERYYNSHTKTTMSLKDFISYWHNYTKIPDNKQCLYLKDWHFLKAFPDHNIYSTPKIFASDWLNEYLLSKPDFDDYRFVYMGPKGSWTPLHSDVFSSFSWSVNICGKKKWAFFPPGQEFYLKDKFGKLVYSIDSEDLKDSSLYPNYESMTEPYILIQEVGDAVFVPSGWHHQVWNLENTISINHNWINARNIEIMWKDLLHNLKVVEEEVADCKDMEDWEVHCQLILKSVYGMDITDFLNFLFYIANVRLDCLDNDKPLKTNNTDYCFGRNHILHDLLSLYNVLCSIKRNNLACILNQTEKILNFINRIDKFK